MGVSLIGLAMVSLLAYDIITFLQDVPHLPCKPHTRPNACEESAHSRKHLPMSTVGAFAPEVPRGCDAPTRALAADDVLYCAGAFVLYKEIDELDVRNATSAPL